MFQLRELQSDLKPWLPWSHHPQSGSANPQENSLSTATCQPMNERRKTEGKKDTTLFLIVKMSVTLPQGHIENLSALPRQEKVTSWGRAEGKSGWVTSSWNILSPRPYLVLPYRCWPGVSHSTRASDWTPLPWASSSHLPSLSNKQTNKQTNKQIPHLPPFRTKGLNLGAPRDRGSPGVRGEAEQTGKRPKRRGSGEATRLIFSFFAVPAWLCLVAEPGWARVINPREDLYMCVCLNILSSTGDLGGAGAGGMTGPFRELACPTPRTGRLLESCSHPD